MGNLEIGDSFQVGEVMDSGYSTEDLDPVEHGLALSAEVTVGYKGSVPPTQRALNALVLSWVDAHAEVLGFNIMPTLRSFMSEKHPSIDMSGIVDEEVTVVDPDQVDYSVQVDEDTSTLSFLVDILHEVGNP